MRLQVQVQRDHIERLVDRFTPIGAVAELVWNALDGDATRVDVFLDDGPLGGIESVRIVDNGHGIARDIAEKSFGDLGDSWKKGRKSPGGRALHGEKGEGRFSALAIGGRVRWQTRWQDVVGVKEYEITAVHTGVGEFDLSEPKASRSRMTGTEVEITSIEKMPKSLVGDDPVARLAELFALYLLRFPDVQVWFCGTRVDPSKIWKRVDTLPVLDAARDDGQPVEATVTIIEWKHKVGRELVLCDANGCALAVRKVSIHTPGFNNFSAYLKSDLIRERQSVLDLDELYGELRRLMEATKAVVKGHFRERAAEEARAVVEQWKEEKVYPYEGNPTGPVEAAERQVFDVVALNITEYAPDFAATDAIAKRITFRILKAAIEQSPDTVRRIFQEVLNLPAAKREEMAELLDHVSLSSIISASKVVVDRQKFLEGLHVVLYDFEARKTTKERQHLQRLVADNVWLFGEEYHLSVDDQALEEVLRKHQTLLGERSDQESGPVLRPDGKQGIVDLMLSKKVASHRPNEYEHLVIELKRPSQKINAKVLQQVEEYAFAVAGDERFRNPKVRWVFWALSNDMDEFARRKACQSHLPPGCVFQSENPNITIWAKTWNQVLEDANGRMAFYRGQLDLMVTHEEGVRHLQRVHGDHLPAVLKASSAQPPADQGNAVPFRRVTGAEVRPFVNCVPVYELKIAAGRFGVQQTVDEVPQVGEATNPDGYDWAGLEGRTKPGPGLFVAQVVGESMNKRIPNGAWCVWRLNPSGAQQGKVVLAMHRDIHDSETGGQFTVKVYESEQVADADGGWEYSRILLKPSSSDPRFEPIVLDATAEGELAIVAELVEVMSGGVRHEEQA